MTTHEHWCWPKRSRFFSGRLLTADDFTEEQWYHREKHRRHVLALHYAERLVDRLPRWKT